MVINVAFTTGMNTSCEACDIFGHLQLIETKKEQLVRWPFQTKREYKNTPSGDTSACRHDTSDSALLTYF